MARVVKNKELMNTRLATNYGGWMYCDVCGRILAICAMRRMMRSIFGLSVSVERKARVRINFEDSGRESLARMSW